MSLLQETLDEIESEAEEKSSTAIANADKIRELECLVKTLNENGAEFVKPCLTVFTHCRDVSPRIIIQGAVEYDALINALNKSLVYTTEQKVSRYDGRESTIHRIVGMSAFIECFDVPNKPELAA